MRCMICIDDSSACKYISCLSVCKRGIAAIRPRAKTGEDQMEFFCKTLTASDTGTHGGFSVPRRAAKKIVPALHPCQEIQARDIHDNVWTFRYIFRGQPKRTLLITGLSLFVDGRKLFAVRASSWATFNLTGCDGLIS